jgi:hypothetical protein
MRRSMILIMIMMLGFSNIETIDIREFSHKDILTIEEHTKRIVFLMSWTKI